MLQALLSFGAGLATVASPCILPMLPLLLGATMAPTGPGPGARAAARWRPLWLVLGFVLSFSAAALVFGASAQALGSAPQRLRQASLLVMAGLGLLLLWPAAQDRLMARLATPLGRLADWGQRLADRAPPSAAGAALLGLSLGLLWTPCAGPVLASVLALVASERDTARAAGLLLCFAAGAGVPMLAIAHGGQRLAHRVRALAPWTVRLRQGFGVLVIATTLAMATGHDTTLLAAVAALAPAGPAATQRSAEPTSQPSAQPSAGAPASAAAPGFSGIGLWLNSPPLTMDSLRGQVVLVDFWTFGCINCLRTVPQLRQWQARYAAQGLVVVGVHTPEFAHEHDAARLRAAVQRLGIGYPVAQDNQRRTWDAWWVQAWPTQVLVGRDGRILWRHVGEGDEAEIEQQIRAALTR